MSTAATSKLPRRPLGKTGLQLSVLGYGAGVLGNIYDILTDTTTITVVTCTEHIQDVKVDVDQARAAVHAAFNAGINLFDTSPYYGETRSEQVLGEALKGLPRDQIVVCTKCGRYGSEKFDFSAARIEASIHESLQRLQLEYVDILLCHDVEFGDLTQVINETLPAVVKLKQKGLVKAVGFSCLPLNTMKYVLDRVAPGTVDCILSYCHNSLNDSTLVDFVPYLESKGVGVINASPFSMGLLTPQGPSSWHPAPAELRIACSQAAALAQAEGVPITHLGLQHAVKEPRISSTLVGMGTAQQVHDNVSCVLKALGLEDNPQKELEQAVLGQVMEVLEPVLGVTWPQGHPTPSD